MKEQEAIRVLRNYESDYDNFLKGLFKRKNAKKNKAEIVTADAKQADKDFQQAVKEKKPRIFKRLTNFFKDIGGVEGAKDTAGNVMQFFKDDSPSDYDISVGGKKDNEQQDNKILGMPPIAAYSIGGILALTIIYGAVKGIQLITKPNIQVTQ